MEDALPIHLSEVSGVPFYRQIVDQMTDLIVSGEVRPGARLPSVRVLARTLLVSLITVRRSYSELELAGLIKRRQGQGTFVAENVELSSQAEEHARQALQDAVLKSFQLGMSSQKIRALVETCLATHEET